MPRLPKLRGPFGSLRRLGAWTLRGGAGVRFFLATGGRWYPRPLTPAQHRVNVARVRSGGPQGFSDLAFFLAPAGSPTRETPKEGGMRFFGKLVGRGKKGAGGPAGGRAEAP